MADNQTPLQLPFERPNVLAVPPLFFMLQREEPIARVRTPAGDVGWLVTRYEYVRALLADDRLGRSHPHPERAARYSGSALMGGPFGNPESEKADHERMRRMLGPSFSARRMRSLTADVQALVDDLLDRMAAQTPPVDFHEVLSFPLPVLVICRLLGIPTDDRDRLRLWSDATAAFYEPEQATAGFDALKEYMRELVEDKRRRPGDDVISDLIAASGRMDDLNVEFITTLAASLLFAGHVTTVTRIDHGTLHLLTAPDQREALQRDPSLAPAAVEEILRAAAPGSGALPRYAQADIEVGGVTIKSGDLVMIAFQAANRDSEVFSDADRFDIARAPNPHMAFGYGNHFCVGANLARLELQVVFAALFQRFPGLRLAVGIDELRVRDYLFAGGLEALPVAW